MALDFERIAVIGATGPTGRILVSELAARGYRLRAVSRRTDVLNAQFPSDDIEKYSGDALDFASLAPALQDCDLVIDSIGLPGDRMSDHPVTAKNIARYVKEAKARCLQISSYWCYMPIRDLPVTEQHPRIEGPVWARLRRQTEDILRDCGGAIVHLPDFFGPHVHTSTLQNGVVEAIEGKPMNWIGSAGTKRDYIYVPDAMKIVAELITEDEAYGDDWVLPGSGPISGEEIAALLTELLERQVRVRAASPWMLRIVSLFNKELRGFMQMVPEYVKPISYDGSKLERLIGSTKRTPYREALHSTIESIRDTKAREQGAGPAFSFSDRLEASYEVVGPL